LEVLGVYSRSRSDVSWSPLVGRTKTLAETFNESGILKIFVYRNAVTWIAKLKFFAWYPKFRSRPTGRKRAGWKLEKIGRGSCRTHSLLLQLNFNATATGNTKLQTADCACLNLIEHLAKLKCILLRSRRFWPGNAKQRAPNQPGQVK